jgi:hypothetical protein
MVTVKHQRQKHLAKIKSAISENGYAQESVHYELNVQICLQLHNVSSSQPTSNSRQEVDQELTNFQGPGNFQ